MEKFEIISHIKELQAKLDNEPYGKELNGKIFPPNVHAYARIVDNLIDALINLHNIDNQFVTLNTNQGVKSIKDNEVNRMFVSLAKTKRNQCDNFYVDEEMDRVSRLIDLQFSYIVKL